MSTVLWIYTSNVGLSTFIKIYFIPYLVSRSSSPPTPSLIRISIARQPLYVRAPESFVNPTDPFTGIVMLTYLHHSDPTIPHFRNKEWSFLRGALATVDRPLLGWAGRFFLHNVSHDHIGHHLFSTIPFCMSSHDRSRYIPWWLIG